MVEGDHRIRHRIRRIADSPVTAVSSMGIFGGSTYALSEIADNKPLNNSLIIGLFTIAAVSALTAFRYSWQNPNIRPPRYRNQP